MYICIATYILYGLQYMRQDPFIFHQANVKENTLYAYITITYTYIYVCMYVCIYVLPHIFYMDYNI